MTRDHVMNTVSAERDYQDRMAADTSRPDMVPDLHLGDTIAAIQYNLAKCTDAWYRGAYPHTDAMQYMCKIAALCVQAGERYGMPEREPKS